MTHSGVIKNVAINLAYIAVVIGIALAVWAGAAAAVGAESVLPDLGETFKELGRVLRLPAFYSALSKTLLRSIIGYAVSVALAFVLFYLSSAFKIAAGLIRPVVSLLRTLPTMAVSLILAIWAGADAAPVILGIMVIAPTVYSALVARTATVSRELTEVARICGAGRTKTFLFVTLPNAAAALPESLSSALSFNIKIVIAAEILMQTTKSLGILMAQAQTYYMTATLIALVAAAVVVSVALEYFVRAVLYFSLARYRD